VQREPTVANKAQGEALERLIAGDEVIADRVDDQSQELILLQSPDILL
jgi:hypothetical protein